MSLYITVQLYDVFGLKNLYLVASYYLNDIVMFTLEPYMDGEVNFCPMQF